MATVEARNLATGTWRAIICDGYNPDGTQKRIRRTIKVNPNSTEESQRRQAKKQAETLETDYLRHLITVAKKIRLSEVAEEYLESKPMAESTKAGYLALYERRIKPKLGNIFVQDLTPRQIRDFYKYLQTDPARPAHKVSKDEKKPKPKTRSKSGFLSGTSRKHYHQFLSAVLNFAVKSGYIVVNPIKAVDPPQQDTPEAECLDEEDFAKLMKTLEDYPDPMWKAFFILDLFTACRPGELIALNWSDFEFKEIEGTEKVQAILTIRAGSNHIKGKGTVRTSKPKTKSSIRPFILPPEICQPILKWKSSQAKQRLKCGDGWEEPDAVFTSETGRRLYISTPTHKWREMQQEYELKNVPLYSLRHTGISFLIANGCDVKEVASYAGHSRPTTTLDKYTHLFRKAHEHTANSDNNFRCIDFL